MHSAICFDVFKLNVYTNNVVNFAIPSFTYINHFAWVH